MAVAGVIATLLPNRDLIRMWQVFYDGHHRDTPTVIHDGREMTSLGLVAATNRTIHREALKLAYMLTNRPSNALWGLKPNDIDPRKIIYDDRNAAKFQHML